MFLTVKARYAQRNLHNYNTCCVDFLYREARVVFRDFHSAAVMVQSAIVAQLLTATNLERY